MQLFEVYLITKLSLLQPLNTLTHHQQSSMRIGTALFVLLITESMSMIMS